MGEGAWQQSRAPLKLAPTCPGLPLHPDTQPHPLKAPHHKMLRVTSSGFRKQHPGAQTDVWPGQQRATPWEAHQDGTPGPGLLCWGHGEGRDPRWTPSGPWLPMHAPFPNTTPAQVTGRKVEVAMSRHRTSLPRQESSPPLAVATVRPDSCKIKGKKAHQQPRALRGGWGVPARGAAFLLVRLSPPCFTSDWLTSIPLRVARCVLPPVLDLKLWPGRERHPLLGTSGWMPFSAPAFLGNTLGIRGDDPLRGVEHTGVSTD